jgi:hypothetical protein
MGRYEPRSGRRAANAWSSQSGPAILQALRTRFAIPSTEQHIRIGRSRNDMSPGALLWAWTLWAPLLPFPSCSHTRRNQPSDELRRGFCLQAACTCPLPGGGSANATSQAVPLASKANQPNVSSYRVNTLWPDVGAQPFTQPSNQHNGAGRGQCSDNGSSPRWLYSDEGLYQPLGEAGKHQEDQNLDTRF